MKKVRGFCFLLNWSCEGGVLLSCRCTLYVRARLFGLVGLLCTVMLVNGNERLLGSLLMAAVAWLKDSYGMPAFDIWTVSVMPSLVSN